MNSFDDQSSFADSDQILGDLGDPWTFFAIQETAKFLNHDIMTDSH